MPRESIPHVCDLSTNIGGISSSPLATSNFVNNELCEAPSGLSETAGKRNLRAQRRHEIVSVRPLETSRTVASAWRADRESGKR